MNGKANSFGKLDKSVNNLILPASSVLAFHQVKATAPSDVIKQLFKAQNLGLPCKNYHRKFVAPKQFLSMVYESAPHHCHFDCQVPRVFEFPSKYLLF